MLSDALTQIRRSAGDALRFGAAQAWPRMRKAAHWLSRLRLWRFLSQKRIRSASLAIGLAIAGPILALLTFVTLSSADTETLASVWFRLLILTDICYLVGLTALIGLQIARLVIARRKRSAGSKLHLRMVGFFAGVAAAPAILVAVFFFLVIQLGFEAWFSEQVRSIVSNSREVATAYAREHRETIRGETAALVNELNQLGRAVADVGAPRFQSGLDRAIRNSRFRDVYILNETGAVVARGSDSFLFAFTPPQPQALEQVSLRGFVIIEDRDNDEMRALARLDGLFERYLYATRAVDGGVLSVLERTDRGVTLYNRLEQNREAWMAQFAALYLGFAVLVLAAAIYLGLWFAERLARPIGRLASAAHRVRKGDRFVRVKEERGDDEIALLSRTFNRMTEEVQRKQDMLTDAKEESETRRLFTETVLSGVSAGVIGLDSEARLRLINRSGANLLQLSAQRDIGKPFTELAPEFAELVAKATLDPSVGLERPIRVLRNEEERELLARIAAERLDEDEGGAVVGFVVTLDDVTDLVSAQRMAAWGDVARRIAHEIKNPLTPIQLAAERLKRKYSDRLGEDSELFERYTETIVRQTGDIGRMVDAFVRFAKLPSPKMADEDLVALVNEAVLLQREARTHIRYSVSAPEHPILVRADRGQLMQAFTNVLQNAADSIQARLAAEEVEGEEVEGAGEGGAAASPQPEIRVGVEIKDDRRVVAQVLDNGVGLPKTERRRLFEPYVTTREKGAGLGLAIVLKIIEEHGGDLALTDAPAFQDGARQGACARFTLPIARPKTASAPDDSTKAEPSDRPETVSEEAAL